MQRGFVLAPLVLLACSSFGSEPTGSEADAGGSPPVGADASIPDGAVAEVADGSVECTRRRFSDGFLRNDLVGGGWDAFPYDAGDSLKLELDSAFHTGDGKSLKIYAAPRAQGESTYFTKVSDVGRCPIRLTFSLRVEEAPKNEEYVTLATIVLTSDTATFLTLKGSGFFVMEQRQGGAAGASTKSRPLPSPATHAWTKIDFRYDPTAQPPAIDVTVGAEPTVHYDTVLETGAPQKVHVGAAWASYGVASTLSIDDVSIE